MSVQLKRLEKEGFSGVRNMLVGHVTPDLNWVPQGFDERTYYINSPDDFDGHDWPEGSDSPVAYSFSLTLGPDTPIDLYDLDLRWQASIQQRIAANGTVTNTFI